MFNKLPRDSEVASFQIKHNGQSKEHTRFQDKGDKVRGASSSLGLWTGFLCRSDGGDKVLWEGGRLGGCGRATGGAGGRQTNS